jgi:transcriptional regulator with XRE-family HTH domain
VAGSQRRERTAADLAAFKGLGAAVHQLRQEKGLTPVQLANSAGLSGTTINAIERGKQDTTWSNLRRLAGGLGAELDKLLDLGIDLAPGPGGEELRRDRSHAAQFD